MRKLAARILGAILLLTGVGAAVAHYAVEGNGAYSYITLAVAALLLVGGWALFDWGAGVSGRWRAGKQ